MFGYINVRCLSVRVDRTAAHVGNHVQLISRGLHPLGYFSYTFYLSKYMFYLSKYMFKLFMICCVTQSYNNRIQTNKFPNPSQC